MLVLDTNVISESLRPTPRPAVIEWLTAQEGEELFLTAVTEAELRYGVAAMRAGRRRERIAAVMDAILREDFAGRILPFDSAAAEAYADIVVRRRAAGRPISQFDAQIAAIARSRGTRLATRNLRDFEGCGVDLTNPWDWPA